jgi:hypothetical protein
MVRKVVVPPASSRPTVLWRSRNAKNRSSISMNFPISREVSFGLSYAAPGRGKKKSVFFFC